MAICKYVGLQVIWHSIIIRQRHVTLIVCNRINVCLLGCVFLLLSDHLDRRSVVHNGCGVRSVHNSPSERMPPQCQVLAATPMAIDPICSLDGLLDVISLGLLNRVWLGLLDGLLDGMLLCSLD